jgi:ABC-type multidrug transport system ATPase subunit
MSRTDREHETASIRVEGVSKSYGAVQAIRSVDLRIGVGEAVGIVGRNGAGKTTFLDIVSGLLRPDDGSVRVFGATPGSEAAVRLLSRQFETPVTYPHLRPSRVGRALGFDSEQEDRLVLNCQRLTVPDRPCRALSKGELLRLGLAVAFARTPRVVLLDEPTAGLDPLAVEDWEFMCQEYLAQGGSLVIATHRLEDLRATTARTILFHEGQTLLDEATADFVDSAVRIVVSEVPRWLKDGHLNSVPHKLVHHDGQAGVELVTKDPQALINALEASDGSVEFSKSPSLAAAVRRAVLFSGRGES